MIPDSVQFFLCHDAPVSFLCPETDIQFSLLRIDWSLFKAFSPAVTHLSVPVIFQFIDFILCQRLADTAFQNSEQFSPDVLHFGECTNHFCSHLSVPVKIMHKSPRFFFHMPFFEDGFLDLFLIICQFTPVQRFLLLSILIHHPYKRIVKAERFTGYPVFFQADRQTLPDIPDTHGLPAACQQSPLE